VTAHLVCEHIASVYQENSPESIYFLMLYNIFNEFLDDLDEDVLPNDRTGYQDTLVWQKLFNFQRDAATGIINKLETYSGCILADSVGLGKTFTALAVVKYYELRNKSVLVLCPKKLADNWLNYNRNLKTNIFAKDRFNYDVLCHTDLSRTSGESFGTPLNRINWATMTSWSSTSPITSATTMPSRTRRAFLGDLPEEGTLLHLQLQAVAPAGELFIGRWHQCHGHQRAGLRRPWCRQPPHL
jgi:SNF2 family DNA or RNA helicase